MTRRGVYAPPLHIIRSTYGERESSPALERFDQPSARICPHGPGRARTTAVKPRRDRFAHGANHPPWPPFSRGRVVDAAPSFVRRWAAGAAQRKKCASSGPRAGRTASIGILPASAGARATPPGWHRDEFRTDARRRREDRSCGEGRDSYGARPADGDPLAFFRPPISHSTPKSDTVRPYSTRSPPSPRQRLLV